MSYCNNDNRPRIQTRGIKNTMRKLMTLMLGLSLALGAVSVSFADDAPPAPTKKKKGKKKTTEPAPKLRVGAAS
jgi:hypothetical protein